MKIALCFWLTADWLTDSMRRDTASFLTHSILADPIRENPISLTIDFKAKATTHQHSQSNSLVSAFNQLLFTPGRLNANGQIETNLTLILMDTSENIAQPAAALAIVSITLPPSPTYNHTLS